ncbi:hypothetical protein CEXT_211521 [Caerostris extrusa]|uniref:Uncharacterized protein n=1 Tax=Caerostris extrusa TaxID=172846 RepID=A0AAV4Q8D5_CAEEX|nr:hypothetical protein CEXT_211521 [Caerostris extrusa]
MGEKSLCSGTDFATLGCEPGGRGRGAFFNAILKCSQRKERPHLALREKMRDSASEKPYREKSDKCFCTRRALRFRVLKVSAFFPKRC